MNQPQTIPSLDLMRSNSKSLKKIIDDLHVTLISESTELKGQITLEQVARIFGKIEGDLIGRAGSLLVLGETGLVKGSIRGASLVVDGFVEGEIVCSERIEVSSTGRVLGNLAAPQIKLAPGSFVRGKIKTGPFKEPVSSS